MGIFDDIFGGGDQEVTQTSEPWGPLQPYLRDLYKNVSGMGENLLPHYPGTTVAPFDPLQQQGMGGMLDYSVNRMAPMTAGYQDTLAGYMGAPLNISQDPAVQAQMGANRSEVQDWLTRQALPATRRGAVAAGQLGGSRQGIAEGNAIGEASKALTNANAQTMGDAYRTASGLAGIASGQMPGALQMGYQPAQTYMNVGGINQDMTRQQIGEQMQRYYYPEQKGWETAQKQSGLYAGAGGYGTQTQTQPGPSGMANLVGMASLAAPFFGGPAGAGMFGGSNVATTIGTSLLNNSNPLGNLGFRGGYP